ncbi:MAG: membrane dipeptidase, partial [Bacteroidetes bacterium HGW-Bacteroidetes-22]
MQLNIKSLLLISLVLLVSLPVFAGNGGKQDRLQHKAARIHAKAFTIDSHNDTPMWFTDSSYNFGQNHKGMRPRNRVDIPRMEEGGLDAAFFAVFVGQAERSPEGNEKALDQALKTFDAIHHNVSLNSNKAAIALNASDRYINENQDKRLVFIGLENGYPVGNNLSNIGRFYELGARYITLCHTRNNDICDSSTDSTEHN